MIGEHSTSRAQPKHAAILQGCYRPRGGRRTEHEEAQRRCAGCDRHGRPAVRRAARGSPVVRGDGRGGEPQLRRQVVRRRRRRPLDDAGADPRGHGEAHVGQRVRRRGDRERVDFVFCAVDMAKDETAKLEEAYARAETPRRLEQLGASLDARRADDGARDQRRTTRRDRGAAQAARHQARASSR